MRQPLRKIFLPLLAACVGLLAAEVLLRQFYARYYPIIPDAYEYDHELAFRLRPGAHLLKTTDHQQESVTNPLGTANFQESFEGFESLVFTVGDSHTQGTGVPADASYPAQLDLILNRDKEGFYVKKFGVVNLGVAGYGGEQSLINLRRWGARLGPPEAILYLGFDNDYEEDVMFLSGGQNSIVVAGSPTWGAATSPLRLLLENTQIGLIARMTYAWHARARILQESRRRSGGDGHNISVAEQEAPVLERLKSYAEEHGSTLVVSWSNAGDSYRWLKFWAERRGVAFADWAPKADSVRRAMPKLSLDNPHSGGHHRAWVNGQIAAEFAQRLRAPRDAGPLNTPKP